MKTEAKLISIKKQYIMALIPSIGISLVLFSAALNVYRITKSRYYIFFYIMPAMFFSFFIFIIPYYVFFEKYFIFENNEDLTNILEFIMISLIMIFSSLVFIKIEEAIINGLLDEEEEKKENL